MEGVGGGALRALRTAAPTLHSSFCRVESSVWTQLCDRATPGIFRRDTHVYGFSNTYKGRNYDRIPHGEAKSWFARSIDEIFCQAVLELGQLWQHGVLRA